MGKHYRDIDGDTWTASGDGVLRCDHSPEIYFGSLRTVEAAHGPLTELPAEPPEPTPTADAADSPFNAERFYSELHRLADDALTNPAVRRIYAALADAVTKATR